MRTQTTRRCGSRSRSAGGSVSLVAAVALAVISVFTSSGMLAGQEPDAGSGWLPWAGCWEAVGDVPVAPPGPDASDASDISDPSEAARVITCIRPVAGERAAEILTVEPGETAGDTEILRADGQRRSAAREGCEGRESAEFSGDGARVYLETEYTCQGGVRRVSTGIFSLVSPYEWLDVRSVESGGEIRTWTRRYLRLEPDEMERAELRSWAEVDQELAAEAARIARSGAPSLDDVVEASHRVHGEAVVAWLAEEGDPLDVDGETLVELAEAGVPGNVTDVLVALSNPDQFVVGAGGAAEAEDAYAARSGYARGPSRRILSGVGVWGAPWGAYRSGFYRRYRFDPFYRPWGYGGYGLGYGYGYGYGYRPAIIYVQPRSPRDGGGRIVNGQGYTRPGSSSGSRSGVSRPSGSSSPGAAGVRAPSRGRGDGGSVSPSGGYRGGSSSGSTGRTARPRDDGGN